MIKPKCSLQQKKKKNWPCRSNIFGGKCNCKLNFYSNSEALESNKKQNATQSWLMLRMSALNKFYWKSLKRKALVLPRSDALKCLKGVVDL